MHIYIGILIMTPIDFYPFSQWQQQVFGAALLQRMAPNYAVFSQASGFGDWPLVRNLLDVVWQKLAKGQVKINVEVQLEKLELVIPEVMDFDSFAVYPAQDFCSGLVVLLQSLEDNNNGCAKELSLLSKNSVIAYLNFRQLDDDKPMLTPDELAEDPLMQWEEAMQQAVFEHLQESAENPKTCQAIKAMIVDSGLSNLGHECG